MFMYENGMNQSFVNINGKKKYKNLKWNADYNGEVANVYLKSNNNGRKNIYNFMLDNNDLANMLNVNTNDMLIDERLKQDFKQINLSESTPPKKDLMIIEFENKPDVVTQNLQKEIPIQEIYLIPPLKKLKTKKSSRRSSRTSSSSRRSSKTSSSSSSRLKPKSHKVYKIYKNSKSIGYLKHKKTSKRTL